MENIALKQRQNTGFTLGDQQQFDRKSVYQRFYRDVQIRGGS